MPYLLIREYVQSLYHVRRKGSDAAGGIYFPGRGYAGIIPAQPGSPEPGWIARMCNHYTTLPVYVIRKLSFYEDLTITDLYIPQSFRTFKGYSDPDCMDGYQ